MLRHRPAGHTSHECSPSTDVLAHLGTPGADLVGELDQYEDSYRLCYAGGPEGIIVALAEQLG